MTKTVCKDENPAINPCAFKPYHGLAPGNAFSDFKGSMVPGTWKVCVGDSGKVLEFDPPRRLVLSWRNEFMPELKAEGHTTCTYELEPAGTAVKLTLTHEIDVPNSKTIAGVSEGWPHLLASLKSLLETGESLVESRTWPEGV